MFKIHDDKVYFVAETPDINKVIEIFLPKDDRGTIMDSHEIRVDLCRAVIHMEKKGVRVLNVRNIEDTNKASIDIWHMPEYQEAAESPVSDVVNACIESCFDSGAMFNLPYSANRDFMTEVTNEELKRYPEELRPQLTGKLMKIDISEPSYKELLQNYAGYKNAKNDSTKMFYYNMFRQGLDILDLDDFTYQMLEMNPNSMGFWFPPLVEGLYGSAFFKVPDTKILRVPITMLQLTRLGFETLNPVTKEIVNRYCQKVFHLDGYEDYFIKTGTYSSKYEFRNAHIHNPKEINEMGEYFLFLNHLTCSMASPLNNRCFYGANTTNEWVVREYIKDKENNPTIYNGLPLHTEYRVFVDFDTKEILGASPYWRSDVMKNEFKKVSSPQERHDYVVYKMHEDILNQRYHESVQTVLAELKKVIPRIELTGQWSVDVMRNGNDYYIIDMALAENSALNDCVPKNLLRAYPQQWLPGESNS